MQYRVPGKIISINRLYFPLNRQNTGRPAGVFGGQPTRFPAMERVAPVWEPHVTETGIKSNIPGAFGVISVKYTLYKFSINHLILRIAMSDFKCNSGISDENKNKNSETDIYGGGADRNYASDNISDKNYSSDNYSDSNITDDADGCGCDVNDGFDSADGDNPAIIYTETVVFTEPYDYTDADDSQRTSDLVEDEQEGSEYITPPDTSRPQC